MKKLLTAFVLALVIVIFAHVSFSTAKAERHSRSRPIMKGFSNTPLQIMVLQKAVFVLTQRLEALQVSISSLEEFAAPIKGDEVMRFKRRTAAVEAFQWTGDNEADIPLEWFDGDLADQMAARVRALERAGLGGWIVREPGGEVHEYDQALFASLFEPQGS